MAGRVAGSRRLHTTLARKVAKQTATTLYHMRVSFMEVRLFPPSQICQFLTNDPLGPSRPNHIDPETENVVTRDGKPSRPLAPPMLMAPIQNDNISYRIFFSRNI